MEHKLGRTFVQKLDSESVAIHHLVLKPFFNDATIRHLVLNPIYSFVFAIIARVSVTVVLSTLLS